MCSGSLDELVSLINFFSIIFRERDVFKIDRKDKIANNDFAFIRAINEGMDIEQVKKLYETFYPDKKENFDSVVEYAKNGTFSRKGNNKANQLMQLRGIAPAISAGKASDKAKIISSTIAKVKTFCRQQTAAVTEIVSKEKTK